MRFAQIVQRDRGGIALQQEDGHDAAILWSDDPAYPGDLDWIVQHGPGLSTLPPLFASAERVPVRELDFLPPLRRPGKILCVGLNYRTHVEEAGATPPQHPEIFLRPTTSLTGHGAPIRLPATSEQLDYEAELVAVIGTGGRAITREAALEHVAAYSIFNDGSVRDVQLRTRQWTLGKSFDETGAFGPWLVDAAALPAGASGLRITATLNDKVMQDANTSDLIFDVATLVQMLSEAMTLEPGDIIVTGTPGGVGLAQTPPVWMREGDRIDVSIERIGTLSNPIAGWPAGEHGRSHGIG